MGSAPRIAIDAMGGDTGPAVMLAGAARAFRRRADLQFLVFGDEPLIRAELGKHPQLAPAVEIVHCDDVIGSEEKPSLALRRAKTSSLGRAINAVKAGDASAALSAGNTGAMMAMAKVALRTMKGIDRPALAALLPSLGDNDLVMGAAYSRVVLDIEKPRVRLLNIGTEELKGTDQLKEAAAALREADYLRMRFDGFTEGDKLSQGDVDVVVTDGFSGNIALKTAEGTARFVTDLLRRAFTSSLRSKAGFMLSKPALHMLKVHLDPNNHNGAVFLGLNGLVVKSHGGADEKGIANAIRVAARMVREDLTRKITEDLDNIAQHRAARQAAK